MIAGVLRHNIGQEGRLQNSLHHPRKTNPSFAKSPCSSAVKFGQFILFLESATQKKERLEEERLIRNSGSAELKIIVPLKNSFFRER
jgi:hypothetical protein